MSTFPYDFRVEIIKARPQTVVSPLLGAPVAGDVLDITDRTLRDGFGSVNRAVERDFLSFKTGDLTLTCRNQDGWFDDLFAFFGPTDHWALRVYRRGVIQFHGVIIGVGSIYFDRKAKTVEMTVYGLTKLLDEASAQGVARSFSAMTVTTHSGTSLTLNTTSGLAQGDTLHVTDQIHAEDATVQSVSSSTVVVLTAALSNAYAAGSPVTCSTPFYRYKLPGDIIEELFTEAGIGMTQLEFSDAYFTRPVPTPVNNSGLDLTYAVMSPPVQKDGVRFQQMNSGANGKSFYQSTFDGAWTQEDSIAFPWVDWSRYRTTQPTGTPRLRARVVPERTDTDGSFESRNANATHGTGYQFSGVAGFGFHIAIYNREVAGPLREISLRSYSTTDYGTTWAFSTSVVLETAGGIGTNALIAHWPSSQCEYVSGRDEVYVSYETTTGPARINSHIATGGVITDLRQADDTAGGHYYYGFQYIPDKDYTVCLRSTNNPLTGVGPFTQIAAFRGTTRLWVRDFPTSATSIPEGGTAQQYVYPTQTMRNVNGTLCCLVQQDGGIRFVTSDDEFLTYSIGFIEPNVNTGRYFGSVVNGGYAAVIGNAAGKSLDHSIALSQFGGTVEYADFDGLSVGEALKKFAVLANALFWVDDDCQGHFIARDVFEPSTVVDIASRIKEQVDNILWEETAQYVTVSGTGTEATAGDQSFAASGIDLESSLIPNECYAVMLADTYYAFYSRMRAYVEASAIDLDGRIYYPLDRLTLGGPARYLAYESDHSLTDDEVSLTLIEDV